MTSLLDVVDHTLNAGVALWPRIRPDKTRLGAVQLIAHRGVHGKKVNCIENTMKAFDLALHYACWGIELDVRTTADGVLVVHHDPDLKRLWGINQTVETIRFEELHDCAPDVPRLEDVIQRFGGKMHLFIELKTPFCAEATLAALLKSLTQSVDYHIISLDEKILASLSDFSRESLLLVAGHDNAGAFATLSLEKNYGGVLGHYLLLTNARIKRLQAAGQKTGVGFVDSKFSLYREAIRGLTWLFSNNVPRVSPYLRDQ